MNRQTVEIASWRIVSELFRRYPDEYQLIETHPCSGQYDCLTLIRRKECVASFNRLGSFTVFGPNGKFDQMDIWRLMGEQDNVINVLDNVCRMLDLEIPKGLPASNPQTVTFRFVSAFLSHSIFGKDKWECRNGYLDTAGMETCGPRKDFEHFPFLNEQLRNHSSQGHLSHPAYEFWFLRKNHKPQMCLNVAGKAWLPKGEEFNLVKQYKTGKGIWSVVGKVAGHLLP